MVQQPAQGTWVIVLTFAAAFLLAAYPLPTGLRWARPEWVTLVLIYWTIALPQRVGIVVAFGVGLLLDVLEGSVLGQNALSLSVVTYLALVLYQRLRVFNVLQQASVIFVMVGINQLVSQWVQNLTGVGAVSLLFLLPAFLSALLWPAVLTVLRGLRRRYQVA
ncbi:MAG: rod shape-determining protein MreD [Halieaceae bacterium]|nr:rod shape-determining protein MreD [Halieaceae bacterium]